MQFTAYARTLQGTGASRRLRNASKVPGIVYGAGEPVMIELDHNALFFALKKEAFHSSILDMELGGAVEESAKGGSSIVAGVPLLIFVVLTVLMIQLQSFQRVIMVVLTGTVIGERVKPSHWVAAAVGSNSASGYQLATGLPVMAVGGFNGSDPSPTLAQFKQYVTDGRIHYFIASGGGGRGGMKAGGSTSSQISTWVTTNFAAQTIDGVTVYDLSGGVA